MRPVLCTALALLVCPAAGAAGELADVDPQAVRAHVEFLADDLLEGRAAGSRGYDLAARYVAAQMQLIGLRPAGTGGGWLQHLEMIQATRVVPAATAVVDRDDGTRVAFAPAEDFLPAPSYVSSAVEVSAPLVFVGFGVHAPELGHDDFAGLDVTGKVAVVLAGAPATFPANPRAHYSRSKLEELAARGAVGIVFVETPEEERRSPWSRAVALAWVPRMRLLDAAGAPIEAYPEIQASISLSVAAAPRLFAGGPRPIEEIWADAAAGRSQSFVLPGRITLGTRTALGRAGSANVIGLLEGADPELRHEYVVFTAHLDHLGRGAAVRGDTLYNGALDNASGVAMLLETARVLAAARPAPRRSILFVAVTAEERGLLGSRKFVLDPTVPRAALVANVNIDMPVLLYPAAGFTAIGAEHSTLGEVARQALAAEGLRMVPDATPEEVVFVRSDQYSFVREGIPAIYLDEGKATDDPGIDAAGIVRHFMLNDYHMPSDDLGLPIHWLSLARLARVNARIGLAIASDRRRPAWLPGDFFGTKFGQ